MKVWRAIRKVAVIAIGLPLLVVGIVLIPLPGPGLLIILLALLILSTELEWTKPFLEQRKQDLKKLWMEYKRKQREIDDKYK